MPTYAIDTQTSARVPTTATLRCNQESFERTRAVLVADRGAGDSYYRCCNSPGFSPCDFKYAAKLENLGLPACLVGNSKSTGNRITRESALQPFN